MKTIHSLFEQQVLNTPSKVALICGNESITYEQLNNLSNRFARYFLSQGIRPGNVVAFGLDRSIELVAAALGALKAGCAYVTLDLRSPQSRLDFIIQDSKANILVTNSTFAEKNFSNTDIKKFEVDKDLAKLNALDSSSLNLNVDIDSIAYLVYTSGTTGKPKGVLGHHGGLVNRLEWMWAEYPYQSDDRCCAKTPLGFVDSIAEIYSPLLKGVPLILLSNEISQDPEKLVSALSENNITRVVVVPSLLKTILSIYPNLPQQLPKLNFWVVSGETLPTELVRQFLTVNPGARLINLYGSSEIAADATYYEIKQSDLLCSSIPIGKPISNMRLYLLDENMNLVIPPEKGEIYMGGIGVAKGYLNQPQLTDERFIKNNFETDSDYKTLFKTGDIGSILPDGNLAFHGRADQQIKLNGKRVELGEIESLILKHPAVQTTAVKYWQYKDLGLLTAYVVNKPDMVIDEKDLSRFLAENLPDYMVPKRIEIIDSMPLNPNGKIDRNALPNPYNSLLIETTKNKPKTELESQLLVLFNNLTNLESLSLDTSFSVIGVDSLMFARIRNIINKNYNISISVLELTQSETIRGLTELIKFCQTHPKVKENEVETCKCDELNHFSESLIANVDYPEIIKNFNTSKPLLDPKNNLRYEVFSEKHYQEVASLISNSFVKDNQMTKIRMIDSEEYKKTLEEDLKLALEQKLSVVAILNDKVVAASLAVDFFNHDNNLKIQDSAIKEKFRPLVEILDELHKNGAESISSAQQILHQIYTAVDPSVLGLDVGYTLEKLSLSLAIDKGFNKSVTELTSLLTQSLAKRLEYELMPSISYDNFIDSKGERPFKGLTGGANLGLLKLPSYSHQLKDNASLNKASSEEKYFGAYSIFPAKKEVDITSNQPAFRLDRHEM